MKSAKRSERDDGGVEGMLSGLVELVGKLNELAESGKELSQLKEFSTDGGLKGVYGLNVRVGLGRDREQVFSVKPFGNIHPDRATGGALVEETIEPLVDVFDEADHTLVVAEMPGVAKEDVVLAVDGPRLTIQAERKHKKYRAEVELPRSYQVEQLSFACNNGILEIRCNG